MDKNNQFESSIKAALADGEDKLEVDVVSLNIIKERLRKGKGRYEFSMRKINDFFKFNIKKTTATVCALAIVTGASVTFIKPVRAFASEGINTIKSMVYDVVKGDDGKYEAVKVPYVEPKTDENTGEMPNVVKSDVDGIKTNMPKSLNNGYELNKQNSVVYDTKTGNMLSVGSKTDKSPSFQLPEGWKDGIANWYKKDSSVIIANESNFDCSVALNSRHEQIKGDNQKEFKIGNQSVAYAEYPAARFPYVNGIEDRTQKPTIHIIHTLKWEHDGRYYLVYDFNGDLSLEFLKDATQSIINTQN